LNFIDEEMLKKERSRESKRKPVLKYIVEKD
jgi:hypothetical protein